MSVHAFTCRRCKEVKAPRQAVIARPGRGTWLTALLSPQRILYTAVLYIIIDLIRIDVVREVSIPCLYHSIERKKETNKLKRHVKLGLCNVRKGRYRVDSSAIANEATPIRPTAYRMRSVQYIFKVK